MRTVIVSKPLPLSAPATTALVNVSFGRTLRHPRSWYAAIWAFCSSQISDAMTPWLRAGLSAVHASRTAKNNRWTCARNTFSSKAGSCAWTAAMPESLPSTPSLSMLGAHDPGITCPYHRRLGRCSGLSADARSSWLAAASPSASQSVRSLSRSTSLIVSATDFTRSACGGKWRVGASARAEELRDLSGAVIAHQQATIGRLGDSQRMREPGCEIGDLPVLARSRPREHDAHDPPAGGTANVGAPLRDEDVIGIIRAKLGAVVKGDAIRGRVRREYGDRRSDAGAVAMETAIGKSRPATGPSRIFAVRHSQQMVRRLRAEIVLAVDGDVGIAGRAAKRETVGIAGAPDNHTGVAPVGVKAQHARASRVGLVADVAGGADPQEEVAVGHWQNPVVLMPADRQPADHRAAAGQRAVAQVISAGAAAD